MEWPVVAEVVVAMVAGGGLVWFYNMHRLRSQNRLDVSQSRANEARGTKDVGEAWAMLYTQVEKRVTALEEELNRTKEVIRARDDLIDDLHLFIEDLQNWADKLVEQLKAAEIVPAPFIRRKSKTRPENGWKRQLDEVIKE